MVGQVTSGTSARIAAPRQVADRGAEGDEQTPESPGNNSFQMSSRGGGQDSVPEDGVKTTADHGLAALLREANLMRDVMEEMPRNLVETEVDGFALPDAHVRAAVAYALRANTDKRDEVLRPGAVYSADF
ncbi:MAG: hypothetical protein ACI82H_000985 [Alphaproteobacteria bacterium]|jgi:hypothetical protein